VKLLRRLALRPVTLAAGAALAAGALGVAPAAVSAAPGGHTLSPATRFYVPPPAQGSVQEILQLLAQGQIHNASLLAVMEAYPSGVWLDGETAAQVAEGAAGSQQADVDVYQQVSQALFGARLQHAVPVFVAYNIPGRDCGSFSAGGAPNQSAYDSWIASVAQAIGNAEAVVLLEPDSLGLIPSNCDKTDNPNGTYPLNSSGPAAMPPESEYPAAIQSYYSSDQQRFAELQYGVSSLEADPNTSVYLDGTNSDWLSVGAIAQELLIAGVQNAQGFFLDVSNYQYTQNLVQYGTWISDCIAYETVVDPGANWVNQYGPVCPSQYFNGWAGSSYGGTALTPYGVWSNLEACTATGVTPTDVDSTGVNCNYANMLGGTAPTTHFVIDTSRNGAGPNDMELYAGSPYDQDAGVISALQAGNWCNPPGAGLGLRPSAGPSGVSPLLDAYLWVKTPGQSDGQCDIAGGVRAWNDSEYTPPIAGWPASTSSNWTTFDPLWSLQTSSVFTDPAAGAWFAQQALQLAQNASPALPSFP